MFGLRHVLEISRRPLADASTTSLISIYLGSPLESLGTLVLSPSLLSSLSSGAYHVDKLQQIHAAYNLYDTLQQGHPRDKGGWGSNNPPQGAPGRAPGDDSADSQGGSTPMPVAAACSSNSSSNSSSSTSSTRDLGAEDAGGPNMPPLEILEKISEETPTPPSPPPAAATGAAAAVAAVAAAAWNLFERLRGEYASKAIGELTRGREVFISKFRETEKHRTDKVLLCAGRKNPPRRPQGGPSLGPRRGPSPPSDDAAAIGGPHGAPPIPEQEHQTEDTGGPFSSNREAPQGGDIMEGPSENEGPPEGPPTATEELQKAEGWRESLGGGRWFLAFAALDPERSRAVALK